MFFQIVANPYQALLPVILRPTELVGCSRLARSRTASDRPRSPELTTACPHRTADPPLGRQNNYTGYVEAQELPDNVYRLDRSGSAMGGCR